MSVELIKTYNTVQINKGRPVIEILSHTAAAVGENNTASNVGSGVGVFKIKTGVNLEFKSLIAGSGVSITPTGANEITIASTASAWGGITGTLTDQVDLVAALAGKQDVDSTLTALSLFNSNGILTQTSADTFVARTITAATAKIVVTNGNGVAGNPTLDVVEANFTGIPQGAVTDLVTDLDLIKTVTNNTLLGRFAGTTGTVQEITIGSGLTLSGGGILSNTGAGFANPMTTQGDLILGDVSGVPIRLGIGANTYVLTSNGTTASWQPAAGGGAGDMILASVQTNTGAKTFLDTTLLLRNVANTFSSYFTNTNTAARTYILPDFSGTTLLGGGTNTFPSTTNFITDTGGFFLSDVGDGATHGATNLYFGEGTAFAVTGADPFDPSNVASFNLIGNSVQFGSMTASGAQQSNMLFQNAGAVYQDLKTTKDGIKYFASGYVTNDRSLTDKGYVDNEIDTALSGWLTGSITGSIAMVGNATYLEIGTAANSFASIDLRANSGNDRLGIGGGTTYLGSGGNGAFVTTTSLTLTGGTSLILNGTTDTSLNSPTTYFSGALRVLNSNLNLRNPANTFHYSFVTSAIIANRNVTLPLLTGNDTFVFQDFSQTLTNKTIALGSNTFSGTKAQFNTAVTDGDILFVGDAITGSTGSTDNSVLRADGTGGTTLQNSGVLIGDTGDISIGVDATAWRSIFATGSLADIGFYLYTKGAGDMRFLADSATFFNQASTKSFGYTTSGAFAFVTSGASYSLSMASDNTPRSISLLSSSAASGNNDAGNINLTTGAPTGSGLEGAVNVQTRASGKLGFFNATAVIKQSAVTTPQGIADALTAYGLLPTSTISGGSSMYTVTTITSTTHNETATSGEEVLLADAATAGGNITINLPTAVGNTATFHIKKIDSGTNTVVVDGNSTETIDGAITFTLNYQYESITLVSNSSNWFII